MISVKELMIMAMINCPECGKEISDKALSCPNCGYSLNSNENYNISYQEYFVKKKTPGKGFGIAGMVLGIIGVVYSTMLLLSTFSLLMTESVGVADELFKSGMIGMGVYMMIFGILALTFGCVSRSRGYKKGQSTAAVALGIITIVFCLAIIMASALA